MVIVSVGVDKHFEVVMPSLEAGKMVFLEWPVAAGMGEMRGLVDAARRETGRVAVGLQGRWVPVVRKVREGVE